MTNEQLTFDLPVKTALGREDFFVSPSNALAVAAIEGWQNWPSGKLVLSGPAGAGKSHLAHVWAGLAGGQIIPATALHEDLLEDLAQGPVCVEDVHLIAGKTGAQRALFHLHNLLAEQGQSFLATGQGPPAAWDLELKDIASRLQAANMVQIDQPDDRLLAAVLIKLFEDRQVLVRPDVIPWLMLRMDRSMAAAARIVGELDKQALVGKKPITTRFAARVLDKHAEVGA